MTSKIILAFIFFQSLAFSQTAAKNSCDGPATAKTLQDLTNFHLTIQKGIPGERELNWLQGELKKLETENPKIRSEVDAETGKQVKEVLAEVDKSYDSFKKQIADKSVTADIHTSMAQFTNAYNSAVKIIPATPKHGTVSNVEFIKKNSIVFNTLYQYGQKTSAMAVDLVNKIETKCLPKNLIQEIMIGDTKYKTLYCLQADPNESAALDKTNGPIEKSQCRVNVSCGLKTLDNNPNQKFISTVASFTCQKRKDKCPEPAECLDEGQKQYLEKTGEKPKTQEAIR